MSLKTFHIVFVIITTLLCVFLIVWGFSFAPAQSAEFASKIGIAGVIGTIVMPLYGVYFYKKIKHIVL